MSDKRRKQVAAIALAVTLIASVFAGGGVIAAQTDDGNETEGNETDGLNETQAENETDGGLNETGNETEAGLNETENETAGLNETENETEADAGENETAAANESTGGEEIATQQTAYLRFVHAASDVGGVNVEIDGETVVSNGSYGAVSEYMPVEAGEHEVTVTSTDDNSVVFEENVTVEPRTVTTFAATVDESMTTSDDEEPDVMVVNVSDDAYTPTDDEAVLRVGHFSTGISEVEVTTDDGNTVLSENLTYGNVSEYETLPAGEYTVEIYDAENGDDPRTTTNVTLESGTAYTHVILGYLNPGSPDFATMEDATTSVNLPATGGQAADEGAGMNETENETTAMNETENETEAGLNETENETAGLNETENETLGEENETMGEEANETMGEEANETMGEANETGAETNDSENESARVAP